MKKLIIVLLAFFTAAAAVAQQAEIYPNIGTIQQDPTVNFSPDGKLILTNVGIWDAATGRELKRSYNTSIIGWSSDMKRYLQGSGTSIRVRDWETNVESFTIQAKAEGAIFSPDGRQVAAVTQDGKNVKIWNSANGQEMMTIDGWEGGIARFCYSADGKNILLANTETVKVIELANKRQLRSFSVIKIERGDLNVFSPNGNMFIVTSSTGSSPNYKGFIKLYDTGTGKELRTLSGHNHFVTALTCSQDGQKIVSIDRDNVMKVWDTGTGRELRSTKLVNDFISSIKFSVDNQRIVYNSWYEGITVLDAGNYRELLTIKALPRVTGTNYTVNEKQAIVQTGKTIRLWDTENGKRVWSIPEQEGYYIYRNIYLSPDKRFFAKVIIPPTSSQKWIDINIYDTFTSRLIQTLPFVRDVSIIQLILKDNNEIIVFTRGSSEETYYFYFLKAGREPNRDDISIHYLGAEPKDIDPYLNSDASRIVYFFENSLQIWDTRNLGRIDKLFAITGSFNRARWSHNSSRILTTSSDGTVRQWNAQNGQQLPGSAKHENLTAVEYSPDSRQFATGGRDQYVRMWNAETGAKLWERNIYASVDTITYSADGKRVIATTNGSVYILDSTNGNNLFSRSERSASLSPDGKWVITASFDGSVRIWSLETGVEKARLISFDDGEWLAMTPDGYYNASAKGDQYLNARVGNTVTGIDRYRSTFNKPAIVQARLSNSGRMAAHKDAITSVAVHPGGTQIASVSLDKTIKLWDLESGKELRTITGIGGSVNAVSFSPDGKTLIHGAEDKTIRIWDAETGRAVRTINGHTDYVNEARYSPDGKRIASCADDKLIKIWDAATGREIRTLSGHTDMVGVIAWSPDGKRIASGSIEEEKTIRIWDAESGRVLQTIPGQGGRIMSLAYSPDGKKLASCAAEEPALKIWDAVTGRQIRSIPIEDGAPYSLAWSPDGKRLAVGYNYGKSAYIYIFDAETGAEIHDIRVGGVPQSLTWTPDGRRIITACNFNDTKFIKVFDALSGKEL
jgi:WD40 repeat protein